MKKQKLKSGFTLSEVLIALTIIGVIAALTVPALIERTNKQEYVSALQKAYSTLSQAANQIIAENGSPASTTNASKDGWAYSRQAVYEMFKKYLNDSKECGTGKGCAIQDSQSGNMTEVSSYYKLILADGMLVNFSANAPLCKSWVGNGCQYIDVDVNGAKKPNKAGIDTFSFILTTDGVVPSGCNLACTKPAYWCTCRVLKEGAINY